MLIDTLNARLHTRPPASGAPSRRSAANFIGTQQMHRFVFRNLVVGEEQATCTVSPTTGQHEHHPGGGGWVHNSVQEMARPTRLGIPVLFKSNARNHIDPDVRVGINEAPGAFTAFPKEAGLAAAALGHESQADRRAADRLETCP